MSTATQIVTKALKRLSVVAAGETADSDDIADGIDALNGMIQSWNAKGFGVAGTTVDTLPLDSSLEVGLVAMLAVRLAGDYGKQAMPQLQKDADDGWKALQGFFFKVPCSDTQTCPTCAGQTQYQDGTTCPTCLGTGIVPSNNTPNYGQEIGTIYTPGYLASRGF